MNDSTPEPRPPADSIDELSGSAIVLLEPSAVDIPVFIPDAADAEGVLQVMEVLEPVVLARYEDCPADPTIKMLPDFSTADDGPTVPRAERELFDSADAQSSDLPTAPKLPELATSPPPPLSSTLLPPPLPPLPPLPSLPEVARAQARRTTTRATSLPPIAPLPAKSPDSRLPASSVLSSREHDTKRPSQPRSIPTRSASSARARSDRRTYTPTLPLDLPRPPAVLEWNHRASERAPADSEYTDDSERTSVIPVSGAVQLSAKRPRKLKNGWSLAAGAALGLVMFLTTLWMFKPARPAGKAAAADALLVTVAGPGGGAVDGSQVFIDGVRRCESSPCLVSGLAEGLHFVTVAAPQHSTTSPRVVRVVESEPSLLHIELAREAANDASAEAPERAPAAAPAAVPTALPAALPEVPTITEGPAPTLPKRTLPIAPSFGFLNLNSIPSAGVLLDGQPLGLTPKLNVRVKPGEHVIVFVHPEEGRRARAVTVEAGARQTVAVQF